MLWSRLDYYGKKPQTSENYAIALIYLQSDRYILFQKAENQVD